MKKRFYLDLTTLLQNLAGKSATLHAILPKGIAALDEPCSVTIEVRKGVVLSCTIQGRSGKSIEGSKAAQLLAAWSEWDVSIENPATPLAATPPSPTQLESRIPDTRIPAPIRILSRAEMDQFLAYSPTSAQTVIQSINGQRNVLQIQWQAGASREVVEEILLQLERLKAITWRTG